MCVIDRVQKSSWLPTYYFISHTRRAPLPSLAALDRTRSTVLALAVLHDIIIHYNYIHVDLKPVLFLMKKQRPSKRVVRIRSTESSEIASTILPSFCIILKLFVFSDQLRPWATYSPYNQCNTTSILVLVE